MTTPIERLARWWAEPRVRKCVVCRVEMPPAARRDKIDTCSDDCASERLSDLAF